jgi:hypothetical protein
VTLRRVLKTISEHGSEQVAVILQGTLEPDDLVAEAGISAMVKTVSEPKWEEIPRWRAVVHYYGDHGLVDVEHRFEELVELHNLIERGPAFQTINRTEIFYELNDAMTIEEAAKL